MSDTRSLLDQINQLKKENAELKSRLSQIETTPPPAYNQINSASKENKSEATNSIQQKPNFPNLLQDLKLVPIEHSFPWKTKTVTLNEIDKNTKVGDIRRKYFGSSGGLMTYLFFNTRELSDSNTLEQENLTSGSTIEVGACYIGS